MNDLLTLHKLALHLRLPRRWLREEADSGRLPCLKVGGRYLFSRKAVEAALAKRAAATRRPQKRQRFQESGHT